MAWSAEKLKAVSLQEFNAAAASFDGEDPSVYRMCRRDYPELVEELEREPFLDLLDAGCGTGAVLALLARKNPNRHYTGLDLSPRMIELAQSKKIPGTAFFCGDCEAIPFAPASFDAIVCSMSFHHYPHPEEFFKSCFRVLRPGGRLVIRDMTQRQPLRWMVNHIEIPLLRLLLHKGDVACYGRADFEKFCAASGLTLEKFEQRPRFRLHSVMRRP